MQSGALLTNLKPFLWGGGAGCPVVSINGRIPAKIPVQFLSPESFPARPVSTQVIHAEDEMGLGPGAAGVPAAVYKCVASPETRNRSLYPQADWRKFMRAFEPLLLIPCPSATRAPNR